MKGAALEDIADLLGHKSLTMTRRYAHLGPNKLHKVVCCWNEVTPEVTPSKMAFRSAPRKLLYSKDFRGVAQW
jgi:hypothetical protein